ncbi:MAG: hypothetical protein ACYS30_22120, partial [Planctomycetota bacterium]
MLKLVSVIIMTMGISSTQAVEPFRLVLANVEQNIYAETVRITNSDITPECPTPWSVHKYVLHGGKQEGVEVIDVDNGKLSFRVVPTRGMSIAQVLMGPSNAGFRSKPAVGGLRLGWDSPVKGLVH